MVHPLVVTYNKQGQCLCGFPSAVRSNWDFHAWEDLWEDLCNTLFCIAEPISDG